MKRSTMLQLGAMLAFSSIGACGLEGDDAEDPKPMSERLQNLNRDLSLGSSGEEVRAIHEYLTRLGYFPSATLAAEFPAWRPLVANAPAHPNVFDENTAEALRQFQQNNGMCATGLLDAETQGAMKKVRCGVPDGIPITDASDKFSLLSGGLGRGNKTWRFEMAGKPANLGQSTVLATASQAFSTWTNVASGVTFTNTSSSSSTIAFKWGPLPPDFGAVASGQTVTLNNTLSWNVNSLRNTLEHEIGHTLGFCHSAWSNAKMFPSAAFNMSLDDTVMASALYDNYTQMPGAARDVGIGGNGDVWIIGTASVQGPELAILKFTGTKSNPQWSQTVDFAGAKRIAVDPQGKPWVVQASGAIFRRTTNTPFSGFFEQIPGLATDVGVGANGDVWITGQDALGGGFRVYKFTGNLSNPWTPTDGGAVKVSVSAAGAPWVITNSGVVFRYTTNIPGAGFWRQLSGNITDIGVGPVHPVLSSETPIAFAWSVAKNAAGRANLSAYAEQPGGANCGGHNIALADGWLSGTAISSGGGSGMAVAVGPDGQPWVVDNNGSIFASLK